jgi:hypothetical protein
MKILFDKDNTGQTEVKTLLGFMDADIKFENLETDIELNTPYLVQFIGQAVYDKIATFYESAQDEEGFAVLKPILKCAQLYIILKAYLEYASNGDIIHGNSGRKIHFASDEKTPWDWQIRADNGALERRAYKALDLLIDLLTTANYTEWTASEPYKAAKSLFIPTTNSFQKIYPINHSGQLFYRLVPFMADIEQENILAILGEVKYLELKSGTPATIPEIDFNLLTSYCQKITAYLVIDRAWRILPEEMLGETVNYKLSDHARADLRDKRSIEHLARVKVYERDLQAILARLDLEVYDYDQTHGIDPANKYLNL